MEKVIIEIEAKTGEATEDVNKFKKSIQKTNEEVTKLNDTTDESAESTGILQQKWNGVKDTFKGLGNSFKGAYNGLKNVAQGFGLSAKASKGLAIGLSALGLPLILMTVTALVEWFKNFEAGVKLVDKAMAALGAVVGQLGAAFEALLKGDFGGVADAFSNITTEVVKATEAVDDLYEANKRLSNLQVEFATVNAELAANIERNRKILEDETKTYEERANALKQINADTLQLAKNEKEISEERIRSLQAQLATENNFEGRRELLKQIAEEKGALIRKNSEIETIVYDGNKKLRELDKRRTDEAKAEQQKRNEQAAASEAKKIEINKSFAEKLKTFEDEEALRNIEDVTERALKKLEIEEENQIASINQAEYSEEQKGVLINAIQKKYADARVDIKQDEQQRLTDIVNEYRQKLADEEILNNEQELEKKLERIDQEESDKLAELERLEASEEQKQAIIEYYAQQRVNATQQAANEEERIERQLNRIKAQIQMSNVANVGSAFRLLGQLAGENKALQTAALIGEAGAAIARTVIQTQLSNATVVAQGAALAIPTAGASVAAAAKLVAANKIAAGLSIAGIVAGTAQGISSLGGSGSAPSRGQINSPNVPAPEQIESNPPAFNVVGSSNASQLSDAIASQTNTQVNATQQAAVQTSSTPIKTYVVASDVTTAQSLDRNIVDNASL